MRNANKAKSLAAADLVKRNPAGEDGRIEIEPLMLQLAADGVDVSSLSENEWIEVLVDAGASYETAFEQLEEVASWGVTDEA
jgi:hypothetical protein